MILHGDYNGQLSKYKLPDERVFNWTKDELQTLDIGEGERIPTLEELLDLFDGTHTMLNIELKAPRDQADKELYDSYVAA